MATDDKDYFGGLTVCADCGGSGDGPVMCCGAANNSLNCNGEGCTGPVVEPCEECNGTGALGPKAEEL